MSQRKDTTKKKSTMQEILTYSTSSGLLLPLKWKHPFMVSKKDYFAIIIGLNQRFEFERIFIEKIELNVETDEGDRQSIIGFDKSNFRDGEILEERFSYKQEKSIISETNYWRISILDDTIWGEKITKTETKEILGVKQQSIFESFRDIMDRFGDNFTLYTMKTIIRQKEFLAKKKDTFVFQF